jgi:uncharacterized protein YegP (UPF0339 family)
MSKWAVRLNGEIVWTCDGEEELYNSEDEAIKAIEDEIKECQWAVEQGYMSDFSFEEFRIVEVV